MRRATPRLRAGFSGRSRCTSRATAPSPTPPRAPSSRSTLPGRKRGRTQVQRPPATPSAIALVTLCPQQYPPAQVERGSRVGGATGSWYQHYTAWLVRKGLVDNATAAHHDGQFREHVGLFLGAAPWPMLVNNATAAVDPSQFWGELNCNEGSGASCMGGLKSSRFVLTVSPTDSGTKMFHAIKTELNEKLESAGFAGSYWFDDFFCFADADHVMPEYIARNLVAALVAIFVLMVLFMDAVAAGCITLCVVFIDLDLLGLIYLWGVRLSSVSFSCLLMSIGLSIDYNASSHFSFSSAPPCLSYAHTATAIYVPGAHRARVPRSGRNLRGARARCATPDGRARAQGGTHHVCRHMRSLRLVSDARPPPRRPRDLYLRKQS